MTSARTVQICFGVTAAVFTAAITCWLLFYQLGDHSISLRSDEVVYVRVTQSVLNDGAWWKLKHGPAPFFEKPPLKFWLSSLAVRVLGESNFSFRVLDALFGAFVIALTCLFSVKLFGWRASAVIPGLVILTCLEAVTGEHGFRRATLDALLTALGALSMLVTWLLHEAKQRGESARIHFIIIGALCGLAVLTKSAGGIMPFICAGISLFALRPRSEWRGLTGGFLSAALMAAIIALPWFAWHVLTSDRGFRIILGVELWQRVWIGFEEHHTAEPFFYFHYLFGKSGLAPASWLILALPWIFLAWRKEEPVKFLFVWFAVPIACFSLAASRAPWYLLPALPACAILAGRVLEVSARFISDVRPGFRLTTRGLIAVAALFLIVRGTGEFYRKSSAIIKTVAQQNRRLPFDLAVSRILSEPGARVLVLSKVIPDRVAPVKGRFNVEGIYLEMLRERLALSSELDSALVDENRIYIFLPSEDSALLPAGAEKIATLPPFGIRKKEVLLYTLGK